MDGKGAARPTAREVNGKVAVIGPEELDQLLRRAQAGDETTLPALQELLQDPALVDLFGGDLARFAMRRLTEALVGKDLVIREAIRHKLDLLRAELTGPNPTPLERLLVERVVACWLQVQEADTRYAHGTAEKLTLAQGDYHQRRMDRAHRRYLSAIKALALVRGLALPGLIAAQVNINAKPTNGARPAPDRMAAAKVPPG